MKRENIFPRLYQWNQILSTLLNFNDRKSDIFILETHKIIDIKEMLVHRERRKSC